MKKHLLSFALVISLCIAMFTACSKPSPSDCSKHTGETICKLCGLNYFNELTNIIKAKASEGSDSVVAEADTVDCTIKYNEETSSVLVALVYKALKEKPVVFLLTMKSGTGSVYGWTMSYDDKLIGGTFDSKQVENIVFEPPIEYNELPNELFNELETAYKESISFCIDAIYSLLQNDNTNNLTIQNLGFQNYTPNV